MSQLTLNRIRSVLEQQFADKIDMSDYAGKPEPERRLAFLSRALAALCIKQLAGVDVDTAGRAVTDGFHDGGLDAIRFEPRTDTLFLVQSKWSESGNKPIDTEGTNAFTSGVRDLLMGRFERFNEKVQSKKAEVLSALYADRPIRIRLITIHSASQATAPHVRRPVDDLVEEVPVAAGGTFGSSWRVCLNNSGIDATQN